MYGIGKKVVILHQNTNHTAILGCNTDEKDIDKTNLITTY